MFTFSRTADPTGKSQTHVSWFGSSSLTYATGPQSFNNSVTVLLVVTETAVSKHIRNISAKLGLPPGDAGHRRFLAVLTYLQERR